MSRLYARKQEGGYQLCLDWKDSYGNRQRRKLDLVVEKLEKRNGRWVYPAEAWKLKKEIDMQIAMQRFALPDAKKSPPLSVALGEFLQLKSGSVAATSIQQYKQSVEKLVNYFGDVPLRTLTEENLAAFRADLQLLRAHNTVAKTLRHLSAFWEYALKKGYCEKNFIHDLKLTPVETEPSVFTAAELERFFETVQERNLDLYNQCLFLLLTGMRNNESCQLQYSHIDFDEGVIRYLNQKARNTPTVFPLDETLVEFLRSVPLKYSPFVFRYRKRRTLWDNFARVRDELGLNPRLVVHSLKATYANAVVDSSAGDLRAAQALAHHSSIQVTERWYLKKVGLQRQRALLETSRIAFGSVVSKFKKQ